MDGIIFDVDGTLWDSVEVVAESWNLAIKENSDLEPNLNREILQGLFGKTMDEIAAGVFRSRPGLSKKTDGYLFVMKTAILNTSRCLLRRRYGHTQGAGSGISSFYCKQLPVRIY